jgi:hypothetical protein
MLLTTKLDENRLISKRVDKNQDHSRQAYRVLKVQVLMGH